MGAFPGKSVSGTVSTWCSDRSLSLRMGQLTMTGTEQPTLGRTTRGELDGRGERYVRAAGGAGRRLGDDAIEASVARDDS